MNLKRNTVLAGAVAAALGLAGGTAIAASIATPVNYASEISGPQALRPINVNGTLGFGISAGQSAFLRFNLNNDGAAFSTAPTLTVTGSSSATGTLVSGGAGMGFAIFQITAPSGGFTQNASYILRPGPVNIAATSASVTVSYAEYATSPDAAGQTGALSSASGTLLTFAQGLGVAGAVGSSLQIDVGSNNTKFVGGAITSSIGEVAINSIPGVNSIVGPGNPIAMSDLIAATTSSTTLTVNGDFSAVATTTGGGPRLTAVYLDAAANCAGPLIASAASVTATQAVFNLGPTSSGTFSSSGMPSNYGHVCYTVSGTTPIAFGVTYTATYTPTAGTNYTLSVPPVMTLGTLATNGRTATVLNIPASNNVDQAYIRIYNTSGLSGPIRGTLYAQNGTQLWSGVLISSLAAHAVQVISATQLQAIAGLAQPWTGRAYLTVFGQIPGMDVQSLIRDANGTLVNVSSKAPAQ